MVLVDEHLFNDLVDEIVFLVDDVRLIAPVDHIRQVHGIFLRDLPVALEQLQGVPPVIGEIRIFLLQHGHDLIDLVLDLVGIDHGVFRMMIVPVLRDGLVLVDEPVRLRVAHVVHRRVEQHIQPVPLPGRYGNDGDAQHFRQAVQVDLHAPLDDDIHHIEGQHDGLPQLQQLQGEVQAPLQRGRVRHIDDDVHVIGQDELPRHGLLHRVGGEAVRAGQVHQMDAHAVVFNGALHLFHGDARPVRHLQVGAGVRIEERGLAAVRIADESDGDLIPLHGRPPSLRYSS